MSIILTTPEELEQLVTKCVKSALEETLPRAIKQATRKEWLTTSELMEYLGCSGRHIQHLRDTNRITFHQHRRSIRYHIDDVDEFLNRGKVRRL